MIRFIGVVVRYPVLERAALSGVSFEAVRGRITAVVGPNGSGKSTLVRALLGRVAISAGTIEVDDLPAHAAGQRALAARVAVVTQREEQAFPLDGRQYVSLGRYPHAGLFRAQSAEDRRAIADAMRVTESSDFADRHVTELSGGEWQRLRLARAIAQGADAIVLDEPTTFLDIAHEMAVFELLATLAGAGKAVLLVSHELNLVARFAQHMVLLHDGHLVAEGAPSDVMQGAVLERVYQWPLVVTRDPAVGAPSLVPLRARPRGERL